MNNFDKYEKIEFPKFSIKKVKELENIKEIHYLESNSKNYYFYQNNEKKNYFKTLTSPLDHFMIVKKDHSIFFRTKSLFISF
jgi:hypothetical protein